MTIMKNNLAALLTEQVPYLSSKLYKKGILKELKQILDGMMINARPDNAEYSEQEKDMLPVAVFESKNVDRSSAILPEPSPFLLIDLDEHKHASDRDELNVKLLNAAQQLSNFIVGWVSPKCGLNLLFWVPVLYPDLEAHRLDLEAAARQIEKDLSNAIGKTITADTAFWRRVNGMKQLKFLPHRKLHWCQNDELVFDTDKMLKYKVEEPKQEQKPKAVRVELENDDAPAELWQNSLERVLEANVYSQLRDAAEGGRNNKAIAMAFQFGILKYGYELQAGLDWWENQEDKFMDLCIENCAGGFPSEEACQKRVMLKIKEGYDYADDNPSAIKEVTPDHPKRIYNNDVPTVVEEQFLDLNAPQPKETMSWSKARLSIVLYKSFIESYRIDASEKLHECCWNIKTRQKLSVVPTRDLLNKKWICKVMSEDGKGEKMSTITIKSALTDTSLDIHGTNYYALPIKSYYYKSGYVGQRLGQEIFNYRAPLMLEDFTPITAADNSREEVIAQNLMELIKSRFDQEGQGDLYAAFYCKYVCQMVMSPEEKPGTAIAFLCADGGTGKTFLGQNIPQFFLNDNTDQWGEHVGICDNLDENRTFSYGFEDKLCVYFDEANVSAKAFNRLKRMITDSKLSLEQKGKDIVQVENCLRFFLSSNNLDLFNIKDSEDRRWTVFSLSNKMPKRGEQGYDDVGYVIRTIRGEDISDGTDMCKVRCLLFQKMQDFYRVYEAENAKELNITEALQTEFKQELSSEYNSKSPVVAKALALMATRDNVNPIDLTKSAFCKRIQEELTNARDRASRLPHKVIHRQLMDSHMFEVVKVADNRPQCIALTDLGLKQLIDTEAVCNYQNNLLRFNEKLKKERSSLPDNYLNIIELREIRDGDDFISDAVDCTVTPYFFKETETCQSQYLN